MHTICILAVTDLVSGCKQETTSAVLAKIQFLLTDGLMLYMPWGLASNFLLWDLSLWKRDHNGKVSLLVQSFSILTILRRVDFNSPNFQSWPTHNLKLLGLGNPTLGNVLLRQTIVLLLSMSSYFSLFPLGWPTHFFKHKQHEILLQDAVGFLGPIWRYCLDKRMSSVLVTFSQITLRWWPIRNPKTYLI